MSTTDKIWRPACSASDRATYLVTRFGRRAAFAIALDMGRAAKLYGTPARIRWALDVAYHILHPYGY